MIAISKYGTLRQVRIPNTFSVIEVLVENLTYMYMYMYM